METLGWGTEGCHPAPPFGERGWSCGKSRHSDSVADLSLALESAVPTKLMLQPTISRCLRLLLGASRLIGPLSPPHLSQASLLCKWQRGYQMLTPLNWEVLQV